MSLQRLKDLCAGVDTVVIVLLDSTTLNMSPFSFELWQGSSDGEGGSNSDGGSSSNSNSNSDGGSSSSGNSSSSGDKYMGHYIVLIGYSAFRDSLMFLDPARPAGE